MRNSLIHKAFKTAKIDKRPALLTYTVAGDYTKKKSLEIKSKIPIFEREKKQKIASYVK